MFHGMAFDLPICWNCFCPDLVNSSPGLLASVKLGSIIREIGDADQKTRSEPSGGTQRRFRMAYLARRYTQDLAVAADDRYRRRRHRRRNLFARADRSLERVTGESGKR